MSRKSCELCNKPARMFCESDQASLCFPCDEKVHSANFLVAKHSRTLLCHVCSSPTPWSAQGTRLGPTVSVCHACSTARRGGGDGVSATGDNVTACSVDATSTSDSALEGDGLYSDGESGEFDGCDGSDGYSEEEEGENQVVPGSEEDATWQNGGGGGVEATAAETMEVKDESSSLGVKRSHDDCNNDGCCSSHEINSSIQESDEWSDDSFAVRPSKTRRRDESNGPVESSYGTEAIIEKLQSFKRHDDIAHDT